MAADPTALDLARHILTLNNRQNWSPCCADAAEAAVTAAQTVLDQAYNADEDRNPHPARPVAPDCERVGYAINDGRWQADPAARQTAPAVTR